MLHFAADRDSGGGEGMKVRIKAPKDFWAGLMFIGVGAFFMIWALTHYQMGTAVRMGPAYFPAVLGGLLAFLGVLVLLESFAMQGPPVPVFKFRPLVLISVACVIYGYVMKPFGLILATLLLVFISALGGHEFKWKEVTILYIVLIVFSLLVFVKGLTLPFPICPAFMETCPIR
jgi:Tripartite tricarboxylate transporter TctB family